MKYSPELVSEICGYIAEGSTNADAAQMAGISEKTLYEWCKKSEFSKAIKKALLDFKRTHVSAIAGSRHWQARAWLLERKFPDEFSPPKSRVEATVTSTEKAEDGEVSKFLKANPAVTEAVLDNIEQGLYSG